MLFFGEDGDFFHLWALSGWFICGLCGGRVGLKKWADGATGRPGVHLCCAGMFCGIFLIFVLRWGLSGGCDEFICCRTFFLENCCRKIWRVRWKCLTLHSLLGRRSRRKRCWRNWGINDRRRRRSPQKKVLKKVTENFGNSKLVRNFAPFFGAFKTKATRSRTLKELQ